MEMEFLSEDPLGACGKHGSEPNASWFSQFQFMTNSLKPLSSRLLKQHVLFCMTCTFPFNQNLMDIVLTTNHLLFNNPSLFKTHQPQWVNSVDHCQLLALKTQSGVHNKKIFYNFTPSRITLAERARETVSLSRLVMLLTFFFVSSERLDDIHVTWFDRFLRRKGDSTALQ